MSATIEPTAPSGYALDPSWHAERERLSSITGLYDPGTLAMCERLGLTEGWHCLDVGAGTGSLVELLAEHVGDGGCVLAVDVDTRFLEPVAGPRVSVRRWDVTADPLPRDGFDLVHARLLLEHLPQRDAVLQSMAGAVRPGGWLLVEDFDWSTAFMVDPPSEVHARVAEACMWTFSRHGYDAEYGRTLPRLFEQAGLVDVVTRAESIVVQADRERGVPQWELLADQLAPAMIEHGLVTADELDAFHALWHDGQSRCFAPLMVSVAGRRPV